MPLRTRVVQTTPLLVPFAEMKSWSAATYPVLDFGTWSPASTSGKSFRFTVTGENAASTGFTICFDYIELIPQ